MARARAGGGGGRRGPQLDARVSPLLRRGAEEPVLPKTNGKWVTARAALRRGLSLCLAQKLLGLPEIRTRGGFFSPSFSNASVPPGRGAPCPGLGEHGDTRAGTGDLRPEPASRDPPPGPQPPPGPVRPAELGRLRGPRGVPGTPGSATWASEACGRWARGEGWVGRGVIVFSVG